LWTRLNILPPDVDPEERVREVVLAAYRGDSIAAVAGASLLYLPGLRCRMALYRSVIGPTKRGGELSALIARRSRAVLEQWSQENPSEGVMGIAARLPASEVKIPPREASMGLALAGFSKDGERLMVTWFDHALV
jgi:hypothetical protein